MTRSSNLCCAETNKQKRRIKIGEEKKKWQSTDWIQCGIGTGIWNCDALNSIVVHLLIL